MATDKTKQPGYILTLKKPYKSGFVACLSITPHHQDGTPGVDPTRKLERDLGRKKALKLAARLLEYCDAPADLVEQVWALHADAASTGTETDDDLEV